MNAVHHFPAASLLAHYFLKDLEQPCAPDTCLLLNASQPPVQKLRYIVAPFVEYQA